MEFSIPTESKIKWELGYTGGMSSLYQSDLEGYIKGKYCYAIQKDSEKYIWSSYLVRKQAYSDDCLWDYISGEYSEDGSEIGYGLYLIGISNEVGNAKELCNMHLHFMRSGRIKLDSYFHLCKISNPHYYGTITDLRSLPRMFDLLAIASKINLKSVSRPRYFGYF